MREHIQAIQKLPKVDQVILALQTLRKYTNGDGYTWAEHDAFYYGDSNLPITREDMRVLNACGWFRDKESESWKMFT